MISWLVKVMGNLAAAISLEVWFCGSVALTILGMLVGLRWNAWLKTLLAIVGVYAFLYVIAWLFPVWLQNITGIATIVLIIVRLFRK